MNLITIAIRVFTSSCQRLYNKANNPVMGEKLQTLQIKIKIKNPVWDAFCLSFHFPVSYVTFFQKKLLDITNARSSLLLLTFFNRS